MLRNYVKTFLAIGIAVLLFSGHSQASPNGKENDPPSESDFLEPSTSELSFSTYYKDRNTHSAAPYRDVPFTTLVDNGEEVSTKSRKRTRESEPKDVAMLTEQFQGFKPYRHGLRYPRRTSIRRRRNSMPKKETNEEDSQHWSNMELDNAKVVETLQNMD